MSPPGEAGSGDGCAAAAGSAAAGAGPGAGAGSTAGSGTGQVKHVANASGAAASSAGAGGAGPHSLGTSPELPATNAAISRRKVIVLVGGGHSHVQVIKGLHRAHRPSGIDVVLIDKGKSAFYSGMMPGCVAQLYDAAETHIQLEPLAKWASIRFIHDTVVGINAGTTALIDSCVVTAANVVAGERSGS